MVVGPAFIPTSSGKTSSFPAFSVEFAAFDFVKIAIKTGVRWNLTAVLIYISMLAKDVEHFFQVFISRLDFLF
jgi:hypothetical protein